MKNFLRQTFLLVVTLTATLPALASGSIRLGIPGYGGTGCPAGSASVTLSPDAKSLSILFDSYVAEAGPSAGRSLDRKTCNVAIPVHIPQGFSVSVFKIDYRGFVSVPRGQAQFNVEYFFAGNQGPQFTKTFNSGTEKEYLLTNNLAMGNVVWSRCGEDVNLRVNSSVLARSQGRDAIITVDSADVQSGIIYHLQWRRC
jgi:hypothetical protein